MGRNYKPTGQPPGRRPTLNGAKRIMVNLPADQRDWLDQMVQRTGLSQSEIVRIALDRSIRIQAEHPALGLQPKTKP